MRILATNCPSESREYGPEAWKLQSVKVSISPHCNGSTPVLFLRIVSVRQHLRPGTRLGRKVGGLHLCLGRGCFRGSTNLCGLHDGLDGFVPSNAGVCLRHDVLDVGCRGHQALHAHADDLPVVSAHQPSRELVVGRARVPDIGVVHVDALGVQVHAV